MGNKYIFKSYDIMYPTRIHMNNIKKTMLKKCAHLKFFQRTWLSISNDVTSMLKMIC